MKKLTFREAADLALKAVPARYLPQKPHPGAPKGNRNASIPDEQKRIGVHVFLAPETVELLKPYTARRLRGETIDKAVAEYIRHSNE